MQDFMYYGLSISFPHLTINLTIIFWSNVDNKKYIMQVNGNFVHIKV